VPEKGALARKPPLGIGYTVPSFSPHLLQVKDIGQKSFGVVFSMMSEVDGTKGTFAIGRRRPRPRQARHGQGWSI